MIIYSCVDNMKKSAKQQIDQQQQPYTTAMHVTAEMQLQKQRWLPNPQ